MSDLLDRLPYAAFLGLRVESDARGRIIRLPFADALVGNPFLPALHGGVTAALLEMTAVLGVSDAFPSPRLPRPINATVAYLRPGRAADAWARAHILKAGRRIAHVEVAAWQEDEDRPIATLMAHFQLKSE